MAKRRAANAQDAGDCPLPRDGEVFALLENRRAQPDVRGAFLFINPSEEIVCRAEDDIERALERLDALAAAGHHLCGYIAYEAGRGLVARPSRDAASDKTLNHPLLHFFVFDARFALTQSQADSLLAALDPLDGPVAVHGFSESMSRADYVERAERIRAWIGAGDVYQVNLTFKRRFATEGGALGLYRRLRDLQSSEYGGFLAFPEFKLLSLSPELFVAKSGCDMMTKPMKGTAPRGQDARTDAAIARALREDAKSISENIMIVDLMRSDIGKLARVGSVRVDNLLEVQTFETLHQLISTVRGEVEADLGPAPVMRALFPCGSITGAPKQRAMQIIDELESEPRGVYTGAIGFVTPQRDLQFNVAIRTCLVRDDGVGEIGVGSGLLFESDPAAEYAECLLKSAFVERVNGAFRLIETMVFDATRGALRHVDRHAARLRRSAAAFAFALDEARLAQAIAALEARAPTGPEQLVVRLLLSQNGAIDIETRATTPLPEGARRIDLCPIRVDETSCFLRHKTTERRLYESAYAAASARGSVDVLFFNRAGEATEASRHNLFVWKKGTLITPPARCGLLPGVRRAILLEEAGGDCLESPLFARDLLEADKILLTNDVRGALEVELSPQARASLESEAAGAHLGPARRKAPAPRP